MDENARTRAAFLSTLASVSSGAAYYDAEAGEVVIDGHFSPGEIDEALGAYLTEHESPSA